MLNVLNLKDFYQKILDQLKSLKPETFDPKTYMPLLESYRGRENATKEILGLTVESTPNSQDLALMYGGLPYKTGSVIFPNGDIVAEDDVRDYLENSSKRSPAESVDRKWTSALVSFIRAEKTVDLRKLGSPLYLKEVAGSYFLGKKKIFAAGIRCEYPPYCLSVNQYDDGKVTCTLNSRRSMREGEFSILSVKQHASNYKISVSENTEMSLRMRDIKNVITAIVLLNQQRIYG